MLLIELTVRQTVCRKKSGWSVISVHDGDIIRIRQGSRTERIRFACIDAPKLKQLLGKEPEIICPRW